MEIPKTVNPDLAKERAQATFDTNEFAAWFYGGETFLGLKRMFEEELFTEPLDGLEHEYLSYEDACTLAVKQSTEAMVKLRRLAKKLAPGDRNAEIQLFNSPFASTLIPAGNVFAVHNLMFTRAFTGQGTPDLYEEFGRRAENFEIIGTYAQTELGHGTFLRGLETRADYDREREEFVLNTPNLTSYKWWPGGLGNTCNYAIVVAQLYIDGNVKGVHLFLVQLRDEETHMPLPGIDIGDIGKKIGFLGVNNGFLGLKNVRIPRRQMMMKNSQVLADGTYVQGPSSKLSYFPMVYVRCMVALGHGVMLLGAATIATRYSAVRRQSPIEPDEPEPQILDHLTQQMKVLPKISIGIAYHLAATQLFRLFNETSESINKGDFSRLPELHALACTLKASCSYDATYGIERLRQACGGHGYLTAANLGSMMITASAACTYEGENSVLYLQVGKILIKHWADMLEGKQLMPTMAYLSECAKWKQFPAWTGDWQCLVHAVQYAATNKTRVAYESYKKRLQNGVSDAKAFNSTGIEMTHAAELHGGAFVAANFLQEIKGKVDPDRSPQLQQVLEQLLELFLLHTVQRYMADISRFITITEAQREDLQARLERVLGQVRHNAVAICDGFEIHDRSLNSVLGCFDGNVYERIFQSAKRSPLNRLPVSKSFELYLKPYMRSKL